MSAVSVFEPVRSQRIDTLNVEVQEFRHSPTGASHFHIDADDSNNAFMVAFRTMPDDSTGVAHILEHTTLCGSRRFPVRDPFFMMLRRSLNTFMNAFTGADMTAYPFATQNRKDFDNLLQVYLDATFFPLLDELDFAQEGHRVEFTNAGDLASRLEYKGVVYNEMKGALSSPTAQLWTEVQSTLFPDTTYHFNSGGDPKVIPDLSYEQLKAFHRSHYHPSNAIFMTYGDFPVAEHHENIQRWALSEFDGQETVLSVPDVRRYKAPVKRSIRYAVASEEEAESSSHVVVAWLLGNVTNRADLMDAYLLSSVLLENSASPLLQALETTDLGSAPSELCGIETSFREILFCCGLEGCTAGDADSVEAMITEVLEGIAENGVAEEQLEAAFHLLELAQREIGATDPYGLQLMWRMLPMAIHGGDPLGVLDIDSDLETLRAAVRDPDYVKELVKRLLLDNSHCVRIAMDPDLELGARLDAAVAAQLDSLKASFSDSDKAEVLKRSKQLEERQQSEDDPEVLPRVTLKDIPAQVKRVEGRESVVGQLPVTYFEAGTNGLVHEQIVFELPALTPEELDIFPLFYDFLTELGCGADDYLSMQRRRALIGTSRSSVSIRGAVDDPQAVRAFFTIAGKGLKKNHAALAELLRDSLMLARFDELQRIRELTAQCRAAEEASITDRGHSLAMLAAQAGTSAGGHIDSVQDGPGFIHKLKLLDDGLDTPGQLSALAERMGAIHQKLLRAAPRLLVVSEHSQHESIERDLLNCWPEVAPGFEDEAFNVEPVTFTVREAWLANTQVQFCARAFPTVAAGHADAAPLIVLGGYLREGFLHREIREHGGAYGAGAGYNGDAGAFRFFSYRDPRLKETLDDFGRSLDWLHTGQPAHRLEEAILAVMRSMDTPSSPAHEAIQAFFQQLQGRTPEVRQEMRERVLDVTLEDLRRVADAYLKPEQASTAVITRREMQDVCDQLELQSREI